MKLKKTIDLNAIMEVGNMKIPYSTVLCDVVGQSNVVGDEDYGTSSGGGGRC